MSSPSWILLKSFSTSLGNCQAPRPSTVPESSGLTATYDASPWLSHTLIQLRGTKCVCGGAGSPFFLVTAISFTQKSSAPSGKMQASPWKTSKQPPFSQHMSYHSVLTSPLEKDMCQGHGGPPAVLWIVSGCFCAQVCTPTYLAAVTKTCPLSIPAMQLENL